MRLRTLCKAARPIATAFALTLGLVWQAYAGIEGNVYAGTNIYVGTLGKSAIVVHFYKNDDGKSVGTYFYRSRGREIGLAEQGKEGRYMECPLPKTNDPNADSPDDSDPPNEPQPCDKPFGYWRVSITSDTVVGTWSKIPDFKTPLAIQLKHAVKSCDDFTDDYAYGCLLVEGPVAVVKGSQAISKDGAVAWHFIQEKRSQVSVPQLTKAPDTAVMRSMNDLFKKNFRVNIASILSYNSYTGSIDTTVEFANSRMFVIKTTEQFYPPGRARSGNLDTRTYDLSSGKGIDWAKLLRFPLKEQIKSDSAAETSVMSFDYRKGDDVLSLTLREAMNQQDDFDDDCLKQVFSNFKCKNGVCSMDSDSPGIEFLPHADGLFVVLFTDFGGGLDACLGEGVTIPWPKVRTLLLKPIPVP